MGTELNEDLSVSQLSSAAKKLTDEALIDRLKQCVTRDRRWTAWTLVHMAEVDARKLYRDQGFSSMFDYAMRALHMSEAEAGLRITAARFGREHPQAIEMLARGELHISAICVLASVLTHETIGLLELARFKSKKQVEELRATHFPKPDVATQIRDLPARNAAPISRSEATATRPHAPVNQAREVVVATVGAATNASSAEVLATATPVAGQAAAFRLEPPVPTFAMVPLSEGRTSVRFTASRRWGEKLEQAQHLMRHQVPGGDPVAIIERALDMLIAERKKKLFGHTDKPRRRNAEASPSAKRSRYIPRAVRREVANRDGEQCAFVAADGRRCEERGRLELDHHLLPFGRGGTSTTDNIRLLCSAHNELAAERAYGRTFMRQRVAAAREASGSARSRSTERVGTVEVATEEVPRRSDGEVTTLVSRAGVVSDATSTKHRPDGAAATSGAAPPAGAGT